MTSSKTSKPKCVTGDGWYNILPVTHINVMISHRFYRMLLRNSQANHFNMAFIIISVTQWLWTWRCAALLCILALILVTAVVICSVYLTRRTDAPPAPVFPEIPDSSLGGNYPSGKFFFAQTEREIDAYVPPSLQSLSYLDLSCLFICK